MLTLPAQRTAPDRETVVRRYLDGEAVKTIADDLGYSTSRIREELHRAGVTLRPSRWLTVPMDRIRQACLEGATVKELADEFGVSRSTLRRRLEALELQPRRPLPTWQRLPQGEIAELYRRERMPLSTIARRFQTTVEAVRRCLVEQGIQVTSRRDPLSRETLDTIVALYESGHSIRQVARETNLPKGRVHSLLTARGVTRHR